MDGQARQTRCPSCLGEQPGFAVTLFSEGVAACACCGQRTTPMTRAEWLRKIRQTQAARRSA